VKISLGTLAAALATAVLAAQTPVVVRTFEDDRPGSPPAGFLFAAARGAAPGHWVVQRSDQGSVLAQTGDPASGEGSVALAILDGPPRVDLELSARVKLAGGSRSGGLVWHYENPDNYHLVSLDLDEQRVGIYRFTAGNRVRLRSEDDLELDPNAWHTLKVISEAARIRVYIGGIRVFEARDRSLRAAGGVGLWSAGDSIVQFDDFRIEEDSRSNERDDEAAGRRGRG
jgi:hypothetical protein